MSREKDLGFKWFKTHCGGIEFLMGNPHPFLGFGPGPASPALILLHPQVSMQWGVPAVGRMLGASTRVPASSQLCTSTLGQEKGFVTCQPSHTVLGSGVLPSPPSMVLGTPWDAAAIAGYQGLNISSWEGEKMARSTWQGWKSHETQHSHQHLNSSSSTGQAEMQVITY